jgi:hypothetical protein
MSHIGLLVAAGERDPVLAQCGPVSALTWPVFIYKPVPSLPINLFTHLYPPQLVQLTYI